MYKEPGLNGSIYHGWALIGGYSPQAQRVLLDALRAIAYGRMNPALERNTTSYGGRLALCGHILRNFAVAASLNPADQRGYLRMESWPRAVVPAADSTR